MTNEFDFIDNPVVLLWFKNFAKSEPLGFTFLTQGNQKLFSRFWGTSNGVTQKFNYWKRDYLGITIYVYSDNDATFYKVQYLGDKTMFQQDKKMGTYLTGFLEKTIKEILEG